jgi:hypothetical protein
LIGHSRREIFIICRISAVDRQDGFPNPIRARFVDHVQRIDRRVPYWMRRSDATMVARGIERDELSSEEETDYATTE